MTNIQHGVDCRQRVESQKSKLEQSQKNPNRRTIRKTKISTELGRTIVFLYQKEGISVLNR